MTGSVAALNRDTFAYLQPTRTRRRNASPPAPLRIMRSFSDQSDAGEGDVFKRVRIFKSCFIYALFFKEKKGSRSQYLAAVTLTSNAL